MSLLALKNKFRNRKIIKNLLDDKNIDLWNKVIKTEKITIDIDNYPNYCVNSINRKHIIGVPKNDLSPASFTHELLHIYLSQCDIHIGGCLTIMAFGDDKLSLIFNNDLLNNITNNLNHIKMLPLFLNMGYNVEDFVQDYYVHKGEHEDFHRLQEYFSVMHEGRKKYIDTAINCYIGIYFSAKGCPNKNFVYDKFYDDLRKIDLELFNILEKFHEDWVNFDYTIKYNSYTNFTIDFIENLKNWCANKEIYVTY